MSLPAACKTVWFNDGDVGDGDSELLTDLRKKHLMRIYSNPVDMKTQTVSGIESQHSRNSFHLYRTEIFSPELTSGTWKPTLFMLYFVLDSWPSLYCQS